MQLPLTWTVGTDHRNKLLRPCRTGKRSNGDKVQEVNREKNKEQTEYRIYIFFSRFRTVAVDQELPDWLKGIAK